MCHMFVGGGLPADSGVGGGVPISSLSGFFQVAPLGGVTLLI